MGDESRMNSAIYFTGEHITEERLINMTKTKAGRPSVIVQRREKWINILKNHTHDTGMKQQEQQQISDWFKMFQSTQTDLFDLIMN